MNDTSAVRPPSVQFYRYACVESGVGRLLVVMTDEAVVDVILGDERTQMLRTASARHPGAGFIPDRGVHADRVACIVKRFEQPVGCAVMAEPAWEAMLG